MPTFAIPQEKNGNSTALDLASIDVTVDSTGALSVFNCSQQIKEGAKAINLPKFWVSTINSLSLSHRLTYSCVALVFLITQK